MRSNGTPENASIPTNVLNTGRTLHASPIYPTAYYFILNIVCDPLVLPVALPQFYRCPGAKEKEEEIK